MFRFTIAAPGWRKTLTAPNVQAAIEAAFPGEGATLERIPGASHGALTLRRGGRKVATLTTDGPAS